MLTKFTKTFETKNLLRIAAIGALMLPSFGWSAADGRGHNGPNLAPTSIPIELDHGIRAVKLEEAMNVCYATGDSKTGVVSLLHHLADELTGGQGSLSEFVYSGNATEYENGKLYFAMGEIDDQLNTKYLGLTLKATDNMFSFVPKLSCHASCEWVNLSVPASMPFVAYQSVVQDTGYDEYGREVKSDRILMGVSIGINAATYGTAVPLYNFQTKRKTAITLNTVEYVECLKNELQKRAE